MKKVLIFIVQEAHHHTQMFEMLNSYDPEVSYTFSYFKDVAVKIENHSVNITIGDHNIEDFDLIYFKNYFKFLEIAQTVAYFAKFKRIKVIDRSLLQVLDNHKLYQMAVLALNNINVPKTLFKFTKWSYSELKSQLGEKFVVKATDAKEGKNNYLIHNAGELESFYKKALEMNYIVQEFIPNTYDFRLVVMGDEVKYIKKRTRDLSKEEYKNNVFLGAKVEYLNIEDYEELSALSVKAAKIFLRDVAGVDAVISELDNKYYIFEVNPSPAIRHDLSVLSEFHKYLSSMA